MSGVRWQVRLVRWCAAFAILSGAKAAAADGVVVGAGELRGRVIDAGGRPALGERVRVMPVTGVDHVLQTDADGAFGPVTLSGAALVYVPGDLIIQATTAVSRRRRKRPEVIELSEIVPPTTPVKATSDPMIVGEYSEEALDHDAWTRAWLLLDVSESGVVTRIKVLDRPGYGLDAIAIRDAFKLQFEPARDGADQTVRSLAFWSFEWPSISWMRAHRARRRIPNAALKVPCRGSGPSRTVYRDCKQPNLSNVLTEPWIDSSAPKP